MRDKGIKKWNRNLLTKKSNNLINKKMWEKCIDIMFNSKIGCYKILFIFAIFEDSDYRNYSVWFGKILWTFWYKFCVVLSVLSKSLYKTTRKLSNLFSVFVSIFIFQTQTHPISVLIWCSFYCNNTSLLLNQ